MGDFDRFNDNFLIAQHRVKQIVIAANRNVSILDKICTNMAIMYEKPITFSEMGTSDHNMMLVRPGDHSSIDSGSIQHVQTWCMGLKEKICFADELAEVWNHCTNSQLVKNYLPTTKTP